VDDRTEESERRESTLAQLVLERSEFDENFVLPWRFTDRPRGRRPFALVDVKPQSFANHLAGVVVVEARSDLAPDVFLTLSRKRDVHGLKIIAARE
jgi:hypothetical protein